MSRSNFKQAEINDTDFLVIDVETTGLSAENGDRVCEVGAVKLRGGAVMQTFGSLIDPQRPISPGAYAVNRISPQMLVGSPTFSEVAKKLRVMMNKTVLVAYNAPFDIAFLNNEFRLAGFPVIKNIVIDVLPLARQLLPGIGRYPQENVARILGIRLPKHRALDDAMVTGQLFAFFSSLIKAYGLKRVGDFHRPDITGIIRSKRIDIILQSIKGEKNLWIKYLSTSNAVFSERVITPRKITPADLSRAAALSLRAFCHSASEEKDFHIDQIMDLRIIEGIF